MRWWSLVVGWVCLTLALPAGAMSIVRVSDEELVAGASLVVVAEVIAKGPAASGAAATEYRFAVDRVLKGSVGPELTLVLAGGLGADGIGRHIYGMPRFSPGERTILFLEERSNGALRLHHLVQGAFREVRHEGRALALRDLAEVTEYRLDAGSVDSAPAADREPARDFEVFARWIGEAAQGRAPAADYRVELAPTGPGRIAAPFTLFADPKDGLPMRWFDFDTGGSVPWYFGTAGQPGVPGGGSGEFKAALQAWNADPQTPIRYVYAGESDADGGLCVDHPTSCGYDGYDEFNVILFGDPNGELLDLSPNCSGTLAYGGPWYTGSTFSFRGQQYHRILNADIVINNGLECFFNSSINASKAAEELFGHELGHTLGIDHSCGNPGGPVCGSNPTLADALMANTVKDDGRGAKLNSDDLAAARALYQPAPSSPTPPPGQPPAAPTNLTAEGISTDEVLLSWQDNSTNETGFVVEMASLGGDFFALEPPLPAGTTQATVFGLPPATGFFFRVKAVNANGSSAPTNVVLASTDALPGPCLPGAQTLCLAGGRFQVDVDWAVPNQSASGEGQVVPDAASDDSGLFYFFDQTNWELVVKVLAACPVNDRFWVFAGGLTNVQVELRVIDTSSRKVRHYFNPPGTAFQPVQDTAAFATCP